MSSPLIRHVRRRNDRQLERSRAALARSGLIGLIAACGLAATDLAIAQEPAASEPVPNAAAQGAGAGGPAPSPVPAREEDQPVLLSADEMTFDEQSGVVTASGNVELAQGARAVRADKITYNRNTGVVTATGNIRLVEPSGEVLFADYAELTADMRDAFIDNIRMLMTDNSRMAGVEGERREGSLIRLNRAVYSPCDLCKTDPTRAPLWQIRAVRVVHDKEAKEIRYKDAVMEFFGIPVAYTPYLSHPDPTVDRQSGLLAPLGGVDSDLGVFLRTPYYIDIAPDQDATIELGGYSKQGLLVGGQYRKRFESGRLELNGSVTRGDLTTPLANKGKRTRGYVAANGLFDIDETWRWGFDLKRASDESYLRQYQNFDEDVLTSRLFVEGFRGRNYAAVNGYSFQDLRYRNPVQEPLVLPLARYNALGEPGSLFGGRWSLDTSLLAVQRPDGGPNTRRFVVQPGWERDIVSGAGFITTLSASVLMAGYTADEFNPANPTVRGSDDFGRFRVFPQGQVTVRYPFIRYGESSQQVIEPITQLTLAPRVRNNKEFPNEDSLDVEFDEVNLFMGNRFPGIDRIDDGSRVTYGLRASIDGYKGGSASLFLGQSYRFHDTDVFAGGTGLEERRSDYVGNLTLSPGPWLDLDYRFRFDQDSLEPRRHTLNASAGVPELRVSTAYTYVDQTADRNATARDMVEQASFSVSSQFLDNWSFSVAHVQAFEPDAGPRSSLGILSYQDECLLFQTILQRDYTQSVGSRDDGTTLFFRFVFKNIGEFQTPGISTGFGGGSQSSS